MKSEVAKIFFTGLLKSFVVILCMMGAGLAGYFGTRAYYKAHPQAVEKTEVSIDDIIAQAQKDDVSKNLIYVLNSKNHNVKYCLLEIFDTQTGNMDYITIPRASRITISAELYQKLCTIDSEIPQIMTVAQLYNYFDDDAAYAYGVNIFEDFFGLDISYYSVIPYEIFHEDFRAEKSKIRFEQKTETETGESVSEKVSENVYMIKLRGRYKQKLRTYTDKESLAEYISNYYEKMYSNLSLHDKLGYVEEYLQLDLAKIHYYCMPGLYDSEHYYMIDEQASAKLLKKLDGQASYTGKQEAYETPAPQSADSVLSVMNSTGVSGVAAGYQSILTKAGYTVAGIGDYTAGTLETTKIIVRDEGEGEDLKAYFDNPVIEVGVPEEGIDIQIIVGNRDVEMAWKK